MVKLAKGGERYPSTRNASSDDSAQDSDSDKDLDSTETNSEKHRKRNKKLRKSPRLGGEKRKSSSKTYSSSSSSHRNHHHHHHGELLLSPRSDSELALNQNTNNSAIASGRSSPMAILRHAKLHTHRSGAGSRGASVAKENHASDTASTPSKEPSPVAGSIIKPGPGQREALECETAAVNTGPVSGKSGSRRLPPSPKLTGPENPPVSGAQVVSQPAQVSGSRQTGRSDESNHLTEQETRECQSSSSKPRSPSSGSQRRESPPQSRRQKRNSGGSRQQSPQISPSCGSSDAKVSPQPGSGALGAGVMPVDGGVGSEDVQASHSSSMSETFTVDRASSFLESVSAVSGRGHRRTRSRDLQAERMAVEGVHGPGKDQSRVAVDGEKLHQRERKSSGGSESKRELERKASGGSDGAAGSDVSSKVKGHRRKHSKDLNNVPISEWQTGGQGEEKKEGSEAGDLDTKDEGKRGDGSSNARSIVLDGRRRHSSGSRPNSPLVTGISIGGAGSEERARMSVAENLMEQRKMLNKSSSLNSLSGRSEDGSIARSEMSHKRSPSIESLPGSSRADTSKRTISNESLQSGGSSRGEGGGSSSKRTPSSESLLSIRTDTSKRSHSNESLPGSARTESSRRSPSNESLPESIREEVSEKKQQGTSTSSRTRSNPRRTQSMGSARDIGHRGEGGSSHSRGSNRMSDLLLKLESITKNNSTSVIETKESLMFRQASKGGSGEEGEGAKHSDEERHRGGRRSRNFSESDTEGGGVSDPGSQLPPRAPSESSSGSHSDDNRHGRRGHRR